MLPSSVDRPTASDAYKAGQQQRQAQQNVKKDGTLNDHWLYKPGDLFRVDENGWMVKVSDLSGTVREK